MPPLKFSVTGLQAAVAAQERIRKGLKDQGQEVEKITRSTAELGRITTKVNKDTETSQQRLIRLLDQTREAYKNGGLGVDAYRKKQVELQRQFETNSGEFSKFEDQNKRSFGSGAVDRLAKYALGVASIATVQRLVTGELQAQQALADRASAASITVSQAQTAVGRNLPNRSRAEVREIIDRGTTLSSELGIQEQFIQNAVATAISGTGGKVDLSLDVVCSASAFLSDRPSEIAEFAQTVAALGKVTGSANPLVNQGLLQRIGAQSSIVEPALQARNIGPALIGTVGAGRGDVSFQEAAASFIAFSNALDERVGKITGTRNIASTSQIVGFEAGVGGAADALAAARDVTIESGALGQRQVDAIAAAESNLTRRQGIRDELQGKGLNERLEIIRREGLGGEVGTEGLGIKAKEAFRELVGAGPAVSGIFETFQTELRNLPGEAELIKAAEQSLDNLVVTPTQVAARRLRQLEALEQQVDLQTGQRNLSTRGQEVIANIQKQSDPSAVVAADQFLRRLSGPLTLATEIESTRESIRLGRLGDRGDPEGLAIQERLLELLLKLQEESNEIQKEIRDGIKSSEGIPVTSQ